MRCGGNAVYADGRAGFTLLEVLAAVTLSATLMAALAGVLRLTATQTRTLAAIPSRGWADRLERRIRCDIGSADEFRLTAGGLQLRGHLATDDSGLRTFDNATVSYRLYSDRLVRTEASSAGVRSTLMTTGVSSLAAGHPLDDRDEIATATGRSGWNEVPTALRVVLTTESRGGAAEPPLDFVVFRSNTRPERGKR